MPNAGKQSFEIYDKKNNKNYKFKINLPGKHNVFNAAASIGVAMEEGIPIGSIKKGISSFLVLGEDMKNIRLKLILN